jgi:AcrR family transcriptional regulator
MLDSNVIKETRKKEKYRLRQIKVLDSAAAVFADKGYHGASTSEIAAKLGIAQSSLYYYFRSKDEALEMICLHGTEELFKRLKIIAGSQQTTRREIREGIYNHIQPINTIPNYYKIFIRELRYLPKFRQSKLDQMILDYNAIFINILNEGVAYSTLKESLDCHLAMLQLISQCNNAAIWVNTKAKYNLDTITTSIADIFLSDIINHSD